MEKEGVLPGPGELGDFCSKNINEQSQISFWASGFALLCFDIKQDRELNWIAERENFRKL